MLRCYRLKHMGLKLAKFWDLCCHGWEMLATVNNLLSACNAVLKCFFLLQLLESPTIQVSPAEQVCKQVCRCSICCMLCAVVLLSYFFMDITIIIIINDIVIPCVVMLHICSCPSDL